MSPGVSRRISHQGRRQAQTPRKQGTDVAVTVVRRPATAAAAAATVDAYQALIPLR